MYIVLFHSGLQHVSKTQDKAITFKQKQWKTSKKVNFINNFDRTQVAELNILLDNSQNCTLDKNQINIFASKLQHIFQKSAKQSFKTYAVVSQKVKNSKPCFGIQCDKARKRYYTARKNNALHKSEITKRIMINACKHYKSTTRKYYKNISLALRTKYADSEQKTPKIILK